VLERDDAAVGERGDRAFAVARAEAVAQLAATAVRTIWQAMDLRVRAGKQTSQRAES
jgi:hypothetical protein